MGSCSHGGTLSLAILYIAASVFEISRSKTDRQTDRQTNGSKNRTAVGLANKYSKRNGLLP